MCGSNPQCPQELKVETDPDCNVYKCSYNPLDSNTEQRFICRIQRSPQEVCQEVSELYNPLYKPGTIDDVTGVPDDFNCDDGIGKFPGEYHCLGNVKV